MQRIFNLPSLRQMYSMEYDEEMLDWRRLGAKDKVDHIVALLPGQVSAEIETVLEVGCGTGDVLRGLAENGVGRLLQGVEIGSERGIPRREILNDREVSLSSYDGSTLPFEDGSIDLVYATHVLEHVVHERSFLYELGRVAKKYVFLEVPLEVTARTRNSHLQHSLTKAGHVNSYSPETFLLRLETSGLSVQSYTVFDHSLDVLAFNANPFAARLKKFLRSTTLQLSPWFASKLFTYHCGALCVKSPKLDI